MIYHHFAEWSAVLFTIFIRYLMSICVIDSVTSDHLYILHTTTISTIIGDFYYDRKERVCSGEALMGCLNERPAEHASVRLST